MPHERSDAGLAAKDGLDEEPPAPLTRSRRHAETRLQRTSTDTATSTDAFAADGIGPLPAATGREPPTLTAKKFYSEYHGHMLKDLGVLYDQVVAAPASGRRACVFLVGDSSLDNKYWVDKWARARNGYETVLRPQRSVCDVTHHLNVRLEAEGGARVAINCAIEESRLGQRSGGALLPHDEFVRDHLAADDVLVVSVGGNDIALAPSAATIAAMGSLALCTPTAILQHFATGVGMGHFRKLFGTHLRNYVLSLTAKCRPRLVVLSMIYYPAEATAAGTEPCWADNVLALLGYNRWPKHLQLIIQLIFEQAVSKITIPGTRVVAVPFYEALDPTNAEHYVARVEPSNVGGRLMANAIADAMHQADTDQAAANEADA